MRLFACWSVCKRPTETSESTKNYSCRFIYGLHRFSSTSFHMHDLHWLKIQQRVKFKLLCFVYNALFKAELLPPYLSVFQPATGKRSSDSRKFECPKNGMLLVVRPLNTLEPNLKSNTGKAEISRQTYGFEEKIENAFLSTAQITIEHDALLSSRRSA